MLTTLQSTGSVLCVKSVPSVDTLQYFSNTSIYTSNAGQPGGGCGISKDGQIMVVGRTSTTGSTVLINYSNDGGVTWQFASHPNANSIGALYFRDSNICLAGGAPSAGQMPFFCADLSGPSASFANNTGALSAAVRGLACANDATTTSGIVYQGYQGFFKYSTTGISTTVSTMGNHPLYTAGITDMDIDPDDANYAIISSTVAGSTTGLYAITPTYGKVALITGIGNLITSVSTCAGLTKCIVQTAGNTHLLTNINLQTGTLTRTQIATTANTYGIIGAVGSGGLLDESCKSSMSLDGQIICVIDRNTGTNPNPHAYYSKNGGASFTSINTQFNLTNIVFLSCCVSRCDAGNNKYILLHSTTGFYRLKIA